MKKVIAIAAVTLLAGTGAVFAAQPMMNHYAPYISQSDKALAANYEPGSVYSVTQNDNLGRTLVKTIKVQQDGTPKLIDFQYTNFN
ncbi:hypothetical protein [Martelella endophytica]|uniref:Uncharacterized protein n=1 Tax=Martelella endophytica TaxID=1486262 RepID=A0A0D5LRV4_MAREN|nr:hypothetical protein [Martelella endophytica]AJY46093.1 hypothetical protein TM49_11070 [Martelella endophytica]